MVVSKCLPPYQNKYASSDISVPLLSSVILGEVLNWLFDFLGVQQTNRTIYFGVISAFLCHWPHCELSHPHSQVNLPIYFASNQIFHSSTAVSGGTNVQPWGSIDPCQKKLYVFPKKNLTLAKYICYYIDPCKIHLLSY